MKSRAGQRQREEEDWKREDQKRKNNKRTEDTDAGKGRKVAKHCVFPMICGSGGSKSRLAKAAGAEPAGHRSDKKIARRCGAKHNSKSKCTKHQRFGPLLEVAMSKKCTPLWREAHFQVKVCKTPQLRTGSGPHLEVEMSKKCTPLWREAHFEVKSVKNWRSRTTFGS